MARFLAVGEMKAQIYILSEEKKGKQLLSIAGLYNCRRFTTTCLGQRMNVFFQALFYTFAGGSCVHKQYGIFFRVCE